MAPPSRVGDDLRAFEAAGVDYCVLRNWEFLDGEPVDDDVDVLIPRDQRAAAEAVLDERGYRHNPGLSTRHDAYRAYDPEADRLVTIDVAWDGPGYNGLPILDAGRALDARRKRAGVWVVGRETLFVELLFHAVLNKNGFDDRERYRETLRELAPEVDREAVIDHAEALFGGVGRDAVRLALDGEPERAVGLKWRLVAAGLRRRPGTVPVVGWNLLAYWQVVAPAKRANRRYNPFAATPTVVLLGPDGSGKTTIATALADWFDRQGVAVSIARLGVYNGESIVMRAAKRVRNRLVGYDAEAVDEAKRAGEMELGARNGPVKAWIHAADQGLRVMQARCAGADLLIADRYAHDLYVHDRVGPVLGWLVDLTARGPTYVYVLDAETETIAARSEFDAESVTEMRARLDAVDGTRVDVSGTPEETLRALLYHLLTNTDLAGEL